MSQPFFVRRVSRRERAKIEKLRADPPSVAVYRRAQAVSLSAQGQKVEQIAEIVGRDRTTVSRWLHTFEADGICGLFPGRSTGRPPKVDAECQAALTEAVEQNPRDLGYPFTRWTAALLAEHVYRTVHVRISPSTIYHVFKRLGFRYGRPKLDLTHRQDAKDVARAKRQKAAALKKQRSAEVIWRFSTVTKPSFT